MQESKRGTSLLKIATGALLSATLLVPLRITWAAELNPMFFSPAYQAMNIPMVFNPSAQAFLPNSLTTGERQSPNFWDGVGPLPGSYATADQFFKANNLNPVFQGKYLSPDGSVNLADPTAPWNTYSHPLLQQAFTQSAWN